VFAAVYSPAPINPGLAFSIREDKLRSFFLHLPQALVLQCWLYQQGLLKRQKKLFANFNWCNSNCIVNPYVYGRKLYGHLAANNIYCFHWMDDIRI
jgi:hypothetical protein